MVTKTQLYFSIAKKLLSIAERVALTGLLIVFTVHVFFAAGSNFKTEAVQKAILWSVVYIVADRDRFRS